MPNLPVILIKVASLTRVKGPELVTRVTSVVKGLDNFPDAPVTAAVLKAAGDAFQATAGDALDGGKKALAERDKKRRDVLFLLRQLAHHVEDNSNGDMTKFLSSGFEAVSRVRGTAATESQPSIKRVVQGYSAQLKVVVKGAKKAKTHEMRYAVLGTEDTPGAWTSVTTPNVNRAIVVDNLTPGTTYLFQVRAFGSAGFTPWSGSVERMCI